MKDDQGELYYKYNLKMQMLEEKREACEINKKRFEKEREESRMIWNEEKRSLENLTEMWGECEEIGRLRCELGDFINEEQKALSRREEELKEERLRVYRMEQECEEERREAGRDLSEEKFLCQES